MEVINAMVPEEVTLRAEEVGSSRACIDTTHVEAGLWRPSLVDADWHAFLPSHFVRRCTTITKSCTRRWERRCLGKVKKAKALWSMKAAKDRDEQFL